MLHLEDVLYELWDLQSEIQHMRENGETDLRTVLHKLDQFERKVKKLDLPRGTSGEGK